MAAADNPNQAQIDQANAAKALADAQTSAANAKKAEYDAEAAAQKAKMRLSPGPPSATLLMHGVRPPPR